MSTITVPPGTPLTMDPLDKKMILFDFDAVNLAAGVSLVNSGPTFGITITAIKQNGVTALTFDNAGLAGRNRQVIALFLATTATLGDKYNVSVKGLTSESPEQHKNYSIDILIEKH